MNWEKRADYGLFSVAGETLYRSSGFFLVAVVGGSVQPTAEGLAKRVRLAMKASPG